MFGTPRRSGKSSRRGARSTPRSDANRLDGFFHDGQWMCMSRLHPPSLLSFSAVRANAMGTCRQLRSEKARHVVPDQEEECQFRPMVLHMPQFQEKAVRFFPLEGRCGSARAGNRNQQLVRRSNPLDRTRPPGRQLDGGTKRGRHPTEHGAAAGQPAIVFDAVQGQRG